MSTTKVFYDWGTERPTFRLKRLDRLDVIDLEMEAVVQREAEERIASIRERRRNRELERAKIGYLVPAGRYERTREASIPADLSNLVIAEPAKRGRGRPRKYGPGNPPPPRIRNRSGSSARKSPTRSVSGRVSSITSAPSRTSLPKIASEVARTLLESTIAGSHGFDAISIDDIRVDIEIAENSISVETKTALPALLSEVLPSELTEGSEKATSDEDDEENEDDDFVVSPEIAALQTSHIQNGSPVNRAWLDFLDANPVDHEFRESLEADEQERRDLEHFVENQECYVYYRHQGMYAKTEMPDDFRDPPSREKTPEKVLEFFPGFGLPTDKVLSDHENPANQMSDEVIEQWLRACVFVKKPGEDEVERHDGFKDDYDRAFHEYGGLQRLAKVFGPIVEDEFAKEKVRPLIWSFIEQRICHVEFSRMLLDKNEWDLEWAYQYMAFEEHCARSNMLREVQLVYMDTIDKMEWPKGFSRIDLCEWAGTKPEDKSHFDRSWEGFPYWIYPKEIHEKVIRDYFKAEAPPRWALRDKEADLSGDLTQ